MYDLTEVLNISREDVLNRTTEYDIFADYLGFKPVVGNLYNSPLRNDSNPSFGLYYARGSKNLLFKDLGTGEAGDCFKFVALMENITIRRAVKVLYRQVISNKLTKRTTKIPIKKYKELDIVVDDMEFTPEGLAFWKEFGITPATLELYHVLQIKRFWVNGVEHWRSTKAKPMFSYFVYSKTKIYRPFFKEMRFYSNCTSNDIQGWEQLNYSNDTVYITKSMKDLMLLHELGYSAVAPNGEGHAIPDKALNILRDRFKKVIILYDRDFPGLKSAQKLWRENKDFDFIFMPRRTQKDLSDYYKHYGKEATLKIIKYHEENRKKN